MPLRLIEIIVPSFSASALAELPNAQEVLGWWDDDLGDDTVLVRLLVDAEDTEGMLDVLENRFSQLDGFRIMLLPVLATLPRPQEPQEDESTPAKNCLATALGDAGLAWRSLKANALGLAVALVASLLIGVVFPIDSTIEAIKSRTQVSGGDIILALASGCAGVLAFTTGAPTALIGVMVAVALLPPFTVFGLLLASGDLSAASGALLLVITNVICVNLAGVLTFVVQGLRPRTWWEAERARRATRVAVATWTVLLLILLGLILLAGASDCPVD